VEYSGGRPIGDIIQERRNIILKGADAATAKGFTQVPNFILKSKKLSAGDKLAFAMLLSYAWQNDYCFPGQVRLGEDMGLHETNVRKHLKSLQAIGLLAIKRRGQGKTNIYELNLKPRKL
jgi:biotin operon repressor